MLESVWKKWNPPTLLVGMQVAAATMKNSIEVPQKTKNRITIWSSNLTPEHISGQNYNPKRYMHSYVHSNTIHNSQRQRQYPRHGYNLNIHRQMNG